MHLDRSNYELWFIDWLDGNLNSQQAGHLKLFLEQNPDLRREFNDLTQVNLVPDQTSFPYKEHLKRSPSEISGLQFDYLCAAFLENDLSDSQQAELLDIINQYPDRKKTFDQIQKCILPVERKEYKFKYLLLKRTAFQKGIRLAVTGLMTAAAIFLLFILFPGIYGPAALKLNTSAHNFVPDSTPQSPSSVRGSDRIINENLPDLAEEKSENKFVSLNKKDNPIVNKSISAHPDDSMKRKNEHQDMAVTKVPVHSEVNLGKGITRETLIISNQTLLIADDENERSKAGKFISKTFRAKFLKEKTPPDSPLKGYEIAEAGVSGLNRLFGWQMVLDTKNDGNGQPSSVYFSSKILKLSAPVKKKEP